MSKHHTIPPQSLYTSGVKQAAVFTCAFGAAHRERLPRPRLLEPQLLHRTIPKYHTGNPHVVVVTAAMAQQANAQTVHPQVIIVTTVGCQFCKRAKEALRQEKIEYEEIEAGNQLELLSQIKAISGKRTVPQAGRPVNVHAACGLLRKQCFATEQKLQMQIFVGGTLLGGADDLLQLIADKKLPELLRTAQGKKALPQELQRAVDSASSSAAANVDAAFVPEGMSRDSYTHLQQLAAGMQNAADSIKWSVPALQSFMDHNFPEQHY